MAQPVTITIDADNRSEDEIRQIIEGLKRIGEGGERANQDVERAMRETITAVRQANRERIREDRYILRLQEQNRRQEERALRNALAFRRAQIRQQQREEREQLRQTQRLLNSINRTYRNITRGALIGAGIGTFFGGPDIIRGIRSTIQAATELDTIRRTLTALTGDAAEANRQLEIFRELARLPGVSFTGAANAAIQFRNVGVELSSSIELMRELGNVAAFSGQQLSDVSFNIAQLIAQGRFNQRDLREAINRMQLLGQALGSTVAEELNAELERSGLNIQQFLTQRLQTLPRADADSAANIFNNFSIAIRELQAEIGRLALPELTRHVRDLTDYIRNNTDTILARFEEAIRRVEQVVNALRTSFGELLSAAKNLIAAGVLGRLSTLAFGFSNSVAAGTSGIINFLNVSKTAAAGLGRFGVVLGGLSGGFGALLAVLGAIDLLRFIGQVNGATESSSALSDATRTLAADYTNLNNVLNHETNETLASTRSRYNELTQAVRDSNASLLEARIIQGEQTDLEGLLRREAELKQRINRIERSTGRERAVSTRRLPALREELGLLQQQISLQQLGAGRGGVRDVFAIARQNIEALTARATELQRVLANPPGGIAGARTVTRNRQELEAVNEQLRVQRAALQSLQQLRRQENRLIRERAEANRQSAQTAQQAERPFTIDRNPAIEANALAQAAIATVRAEVADTIQFQQQVYDRQEALAEDLGRRADVIRRQNIADIRQSFIEEARAQRDAEFQRNAVVLNASFERAQARRDAIRQQLEDFTNFANQILDRELDLARRRTEIREQNERDAENRELRGRVRAALREPPDENVERYRQELLIRRDLNQANLSLIENSERQHGETIVAIQEGVARQGLSSALQLAFNREATFQQIAAQFIQQSVRIIAQNLLETQFILANNERLIESNNRLAASRIRALSGGSEVGIGSFGEASIAAAASLATGNIPGAVASFVPQITAFLRIGQNQAVEISDLAAEAEGNRQ